LKKLALPLIAALAAAFATGCATRQVNCLEVMQATPGTKLYTNQNFWYENPDDIPSFNYQTGHLLPFGTPIEAVSADERSITFKNADDGHSYTIKFRPEWEMMTMEDYLRNILSLDDRAQQETVMSSPAAIQSALKGVVVNGMTRKDVLKAYGWPSKHRTPYMEQDTWVYWVNPLKTKRVVFKGEKVIAVFEL
jgi:hypothetical protein